MNLFLKDPQNRPQSFSSRPSWAQHFAHIGHGFLLFFAILLFWIIFFALPPLWDFIYKVSMGTKGDLGDSGQIIRALWSGRSLIDVSAQLNSGKLEMKEIVHYRDIRHGLYVGLLALTLVSAYFLSFARVISWRRVFRWAVFFCFFLAASGTTWALIDWSHFFRTLHWWVFHDNSWILPLDSTTLALFPYAVWQWIFIFVAAATALTCLALAFSAEKIARR